MDQRIIPTGRAKYNLEFHEIGGGEFDDVATLGESVVLALLI